MSSGCHGGSASGERSKRRGSKNFDRDVSKPFSMDKSIINQSTGAYLAAVEVIPLDLEVVGGWMAGQLGFCQ